MDAARSCRWLEATTQVQTRHTTMDLSADVYQQVDLDLARTSALMLFREPSVDEELLSDRRSKVESLLIRWLQGTREFTYMQGMNHMMAICYREVEADAGAIQVFDHMMRQVNENLFHSDPLVLSRSFHDLSERLRSLVHQACPELASRLTDADVDFFPMIVQNWLIDLFLHVLPVDAAVRLWDHIILDKMPEVPMTFALKLLLLSKNDILTCYVEDLNDVVSELPNRIRSPVDVDWLLDADLADPPLGWTVPVLKIAVPRPKRWHPWKFLTVAMVVPWLLMHVTQVQHPTLSRARPPAFRQARFKGLVNVLPHAATWPM